MERDVIVQENLNSALERDVQQAVKRHGLVITPPAQQYLVEMLERFAKYFGLYKDTWLTPITLQYHHINDELNNAQRMQLQRDLGDHCLFLVGYFYDFVRKQGEGQVRYHAQIGSAAYQQTGKSPLVEIGQKFSELYLIIGDLHLPSIKGKRLIEVYERWEETKDWYYASLLMGKGIVPRSFKGNN